MTKKEKETKKKSTLHFKLGLASTIVVVLLNKYVQVLKSTNIARITTNSPFLLLKIMVF